MMIFQAFIVFCWCVIAAITWVLSDWVGRAIYTPVAVINLAAFLLKARARQLEWRQQRTRR